MVLGKQNLGKYTIEKYVMIGVPKLSEEKGPSMNIGEHERKK